MAQEFIARKGLIALENSQITGSLSVTGTVASSIFTGSFRGDGSQLSGVSAGFPYTGSATISGSLVVTGSVSATSFIGDGSQLTGIADPTPITATINNTNSPFTVTSQSIVIIDSTNGDVTVNLPNLNTIVGTSDQRPILIYKNDYSQNVVYVQPSGSQLVNGTTQDIIVSIQIGIVYNPTSAGWVTEGTSYQSLAELEMFFVPRTETGSLSVATASYVEYANVANKPTLVSGSSQITYSGLTGIPSGIVSGSAQVASFGIFATTGSNQFNGNQAITGSLTVTGQVVAQTLNVQQVTSSIVFSSGSNIFGNSLANTQQLTGSVGVTGSFTVTTSGTELQVTNTGVNIGNIVTDNHNVTGSLRVSGSMAVNGTTTINDKLTINRAAEIAVFGTNTASDKYITIKNSSGDLFLGSVSTTEHYLWGNGAIPLTFYTNGTEKMRITSGGNLGLGVTPSAWNTPFKVMQLGSTTAVWDISSVSGFSNNLYNDGTGRYLTSNYATIFQQWNGGFAWLQAPSGTAGNAISFTQAMTLDASGRLGIVTTSPSSFNAAANQLVVGTTSGNNGITIAAATNGFSSIYFADGTTGNEAFRGYFEYGHSADYLAFGTAASERMRITSGGNVGIGTTSPQDRLDVNGSIRFRANTPNFTAVTDTAVLDYVPTSVFATDPTVRLAAIGTASVGAHIRFITGTSSSLGERMRIMPSPGEIAFSNNGVGTAFFSQAIATSPGTNYYFNFLESTNNATAASIKVGGILASDSYGIASPDRGDIYAQDNISALSFTDRTPYPSSLELARNVVKSHRRRSEEEIEELVLAAYNKVQNREKEMPQPEKEALTLEEYKAKYRKEYELDHSVLHDYVNDTRYAADGIESRDLSATVSCLVEVVKDLMEKIEALEARI